MNYAELFWTNALLLGLEPRAMEEQHGCVFEADMFKRSGSVKAVNGVLQFLLSRLDPAQCAQDFKGLWPIYDRAQEKDFRKAAMNRLTALESQGVLSAGSVRLSDITSAKGDRLYCLLWQLSCAAMRACLQRARWPVASARLPELDASTAALAPRVLRAAALRVAAQRARFVATAAAAAAAAERESETAGRLSELRRRTQAESDVSNKSNNSNNNNVKTVDTRDAARCRALWARLEGLPTAELRPAAPPVSHRDCAALARAWSRHVARVGCETALARRPKSAELDEHESRLAQLQALATRLERLNSTLQQQQQQQQQQQMQDLQRGRRTSMADEFPLFSAKKQPMQQQQQQQQQLPSSVRRQNQQQQQQQQPNNNVTQSKPLTPPKSIDRLAASIVRVASVHRSFSFDQSLEEDFLITPKKKLEL